MKTLEELRKTPRLMIRQTGVDGGFGIIFRMDGKQFGTVIWSFGGGWEHVSVAPFKKSHTPTWDEMCALKDMFFREDETVVQYHPAKRDYVNVVGNCLHLWRPLDQQMPTPPAAMVGIKAGQTPQEYKKAVEELLND